MHRARESNNQPLDYYSGAVPIEISTAIKTLKSYVLMTKSKRDLANKYNDRRKVFIEMLVHDKTETTVLSFFKMSSANHNL